jgi:hypothetical protein
MKLIYMAETIDLIAKKNKDFAIAIFKSGVVKELNGFNYVVIQNQHASI